MTKKYTACTEERKNNVQDVGEDNEDMIIQPVGGKEYCQHHGGEDSKTTPVRKGVEREREGGGGIPMMTKEGKRGYKYTVFTQGDCARRETTVTAM